MASLTYTATDEYGNDVTVRLPDWTGHLLLATTDEPPEGTLVADGSAVSREVYHELFEKIGTRYGEGDGVTTFELPDWRDEFPRFSGADRAVGTKQGDAIRNIMATTGGNNSNVYRKNNTSGAFYTDNSGNTTDLRYNSVLITDNPNDANDWRLSLDISRVVPTADENRPRNVAFLPCIIYV